MYVGGTTMGWAGQVNTWQVNTWKGNTRQTSKGQVSTWQVSTGQNNTGQVSTGQASTGADGKQQGSTGQGPTEQVSTWQVNTWQVHTWEVHKKVKTYQASTGQVCKIWCEIFMQNTWRSKIPWQLSVVVISLLIETGGNQCSSYCLKGECHQNSVQIKITEV
jgi:hypothetical protein